MSTIQFNETISSNECEDYSYSDEESTYEETEEDYSFVEIAKEEQSNRVSYSNTALGKYALLYNNNSRLSMPMQ